MPEWKTLEAGLVQAHGISPSPRAARGPATGPPVGHRIWPPGLGGPGSPPVCSAAPTLHQGPKPSKLGIWKACLPPVLQTPRAAQGLTPCGSNHLASSIGASLRCSEHPSPEGASVLSCFYLAPASKCLQAGGLELQPHAALTKGRAWPAHSNLCGSKDLAFQDRGVLKPC